MTRSTRLVGMLLAHVDLHLAMKRVYQLAMCKNDDGFILAIPFSQKIHLHHTHINKFYLVE